MGSANPQSAGTQGEPVTFVGGRYQVEAELGQGGMARVGRNRAPYRTQAGEVELLRPLFRPQGERNAKTVDLISLRAGVVGDGWLPGTARAMAHLVQQGPSREPS
jgi:hypothetical protein